MEIISKIFKKYKYKFKPPKSTALVGCLFEAKLLTNKKNIKIEMKKLLKQNEIKKLLKFGTLFMFAILMIFSQIFSPEVVNAATYNFVQNNWSGGASTTTIATHDNNNLTNWKKYYAKNSSISVNATEISLSAGAGSLTQTDDGTTNTGFNLSGNSKSNTTISGSGTSASVKLTGTTAPLDTTNTYASGFTYPNALAFDSSTNSIWTTSTYNGGVSKINASTGEALGTYNTNSISYGVAFDSSTNSIWVTNYSSNTVSKINVSTRALIGTYNTGTSPYGVAFDSSTNSIWVSNNGSANVTKLSASDGTLIGTYSVGTNPAGLAFDSSTNSIWVTNYSSSTVTKLSASDGALVGTYDVGANPKAIAFDSSTNSMWIGSWSVTTLTKLNASTGALIGNYEASGRVNGVAFDSSTNSIWATDWTNSFVRRLNASTGAVTGSYNTGSGVVGVAFDFSTNSIWTANGNTTTLTKITAAPFSTVVGTPFTVGTNPIESVYDPSTNSIWVSNGGSSNVTKLNASTGASVGTYTVGANPKGIAFDSSTNSVWVVTATSNKVVKLNASTGSIIGSYDVGTNPYGVAFDSYTNSIWVSNYNTNNVTKLNASTGALIGTYSVGTGPIGIVFEPTTNSIWTANYGAATVTKVNVSDGSVVSTTNVGRGPWGITFDSSTNSVWTANSVEFTTSKINVNTGVATGHYSSTAYPYGITFDSATNSIFTSGNGNFNTSVLRLRASDGASLGIYMTSNVPYGLAFDNVNNNVLVTNNWVTGLTTIKTSSTTYSSSGTYTSGVVDLGLKVAGFTTLAFTKNTPTNTTLTVDVRAGNTTNSDDGSWTNWITGVATGGDISSLGSNRYIQYRVNLASSDGVSSPTLDDITFNYTSYSYTSPSLKSSYYKTPSSQNLISKVSWVATDTSETEIVQLQVRSSSDGSVWSEWCGYADCSGTSYFTSADNGVALASDHPLRNGNDDQYFQYKVYLNGASATPKVTNVTVTYVVNAAPEFNQDYPTTSAGGVNAVEVLDTQSSNFGKVAISYSIKDPDGSTGTVNQGKILPSFEYSIDDGNNWTAISSNDMASGDNSLKDVQDNSYTVYTAVWDAKTTIPDTSISNAKIRINANDNEAANSTAVATSAIFKLDTKKPTGGAITFDAGVAGATDSATITIPMPTDDSAVQYLITDADGQTSGWTNIAEGTTIPWTFNSTIEAKILKYQWKDAYGNISDEATITTQTPIPSSSFLVQDTSNVTSQTPYYDMYIGWQVAEATGFGSYKLEYATSSDNVTYGAYTTINDSSLTNVSTNYYVHRNLNTNLYYKYRLGVVGANGNTSVRSSAFTIAKPDGVQNYGEGGGGSVATAPKIENVVVTQNVDKTIAIDYKLTDSSLAKKVNPSYESNIYYNIGITLPSNAYANNTITLSDASKLATTGYILVNNEVIKYTTKNGNTLGGLTRGTWSGTAGRTTRQNATFFAGTPVWIMANGTTFNSITNTTISTGQNGSIAWNTYQESALAGSSYPNVGIKVLVHDNQDALSGPLSTQNDFSENGILNTMDLTPPAVSFEQASGTGAENITPVSINLTLARSYPLEVTVNYSVTGTATTGNDYDLSDGVITFSAGETAKTLSLAVVDDTLKEVNEDVVVTLSDPINAVLGENAVYTYTITDNDLLPTVQFQTASGEGSESVTALSIPVTLSETAGANVVMSYTISGTATGGGVDHNLANGTLTIPAGETSANITGEIINDTLKEDNETIIVTLGWPTNADMGVETVYTYTIIDDDSVPEIGFTTEASEGLESLTSVQIPISIGSIYPQDVTVKYTVSADGTATAGADYTLSNGTATISAGQTMTTIPITIVNDRLSEVSETIIITLSDPTVATLGKNTTFTYTILDDEIPVSETTGSNVKSTSAVITWTTADFADSVVTYGTIAPTEPGAYGTTKSKDEKVLGHSVYLSGLTPLTKYYFKTSSTNLAGDITTSESEFTTTAGPVISNTANGTVTDTSVTITWTTDVPATSVVYYGIDSLLATPTKISSDELVTAHSVIISGLNSENTYYYFIQSVDESGGVAEDANNGDYYNFSTGADATPPIVSAISVPIIAYDSAAIIWKTNEPADGQVSYGTTSGTYTANSTLSTTLTENHLATLTGLEKTTKYFYVIKSADTKGNLTTTEEHSFDTTNITIVSGGGGGSVGVLQSVYDALLAENEANKAKLATQDANAPVISNVTVTKITPFGATINFDVSKDTIAFVKFGKSSSYGDIAGDDTLSKSHSILLRGLTMGTDYHVKVSAMDKSGNITSSEDQVFKTKYLSENMSELKNMDNVAQFQEEIENTIESILPSLVPPFIDTPTITDITENSATINFKTNIKAFPVVSYATDTEYDLKKVNPYTGEVSDSSEKTIAHTIGLIGLKPNTKYHIMAKAFSLPQVVGKSEDIIFTTKASKITASIAEVKNTTFTVVWNTDEPTSSIVEYKNLKNGIVSRVIDNTKNQSHSVKVENLVPGTTYEINVSGINEKNNLVEAGSPINVQTLVDVTPPLMSNLKVDSALVAGRTDRVQTIVSWQTDEPADSVVYYQEGSGSPDKELANKQQDAEMTKNHVIILTAFKPGTVYRFQVSSMDMAGNMAKPPVRTLITPRQNESIVDVIFKNFDETFNFIKNVKQ